MGILVALFSACLLYFFAGYLLPQSLINEIGKPSELLCMVAFVLILVIYFCLQRWQYRRAPGLLDKEGILAPPYINTGDLPKPEPTINLPAIQQTLMQHSRWRWKRAMPWLLVTGDAADIEQVVPGLTTQGWQLVGSALLLAGGNAVRGGHLPDLLALRQFRRRRPVDALILVGRGSYWLQNDYIDSLRRGVQQLQHSLKWCPPCYLLDINEEGEKPQLSPEHLALVLSGQPFTPQTLTAALQQLPAELTHQAMPQVLANPRHDFLLRLSAMLVRGGRAALTAAVTPLLTGGLSLPLHGLVFTPRQAGGLTYAPQQFSATPLWERLADHAHSQPGKARGLTMAMALRGGLMALMLFWSVGSLYAWFANVRLLSHTQTARQLAQQTTGKDLLPTLQQQLIALRYQQQQGTPWYHRFGMDITHLLLPGVQATYAQVNQAEIVLPAQRALTARLQALTQPNAAIDSRQGYNLLKAYLMLAAPVRTGGTEAQTFLSQQLAPLLPGVSASAITFFTRELGSHSEWRIVADMSLLTQVRRALLQQISGPNAEEQLYQSLLARADRSYGSLSLVQLFDGRDAEGAFRLDARIPARFTRQAYDGDIRPHIAALVAERQEQTSWVLADGDEPLVGSLSPQAMGARLTARYLADFGQAWQKTLNQIQPIPTQDPLQQLQLMADTYRSPQAALLKQLAWQALVASPNESLRELNPALVPFFNGIVSLVYASDNSDLSLSSLQMQVRSLRDRIHGLSSVSGGIAALSQSILQGTQIDNRITQLPQRLTSQLGRAWQPMTQALFIAPISQTWQGMMQPAMAGINSAWQREIVQPWQQAFANQFPFTNSRQEASFPGLGDFIAPDTGRIPRFISSYLQGVVNYHNSSWQAVDPLPPGLTVSPQFLQQLNHLDRLGSTLFGRYWGLRFQLQPETAKDVVQTELIIDGQQLIYFNQQPFWQEIQWPADTSYHNATLMWRSVRASTRTYLDAPGTWGFYRLLAQAKITPLDSTHYQLTWIASDGLPLKYRLAFTPGNDPVSVLSLQGFVLPSLVFGKQRIRQ